MVNQGNQNQVNSTSSANSNNSDPFTQKRGTKLLIYLSHVLSSWGDRMWGFAVGLYLVILFPESLQYTAIYGFTTCVCVIAGGPIIGKWVDKSSRLRAATIAIVIQNGAVTLCAVLLILMISLSDQMSSGCGKILFLFGIIMFAVIAELASVASKIAIEKDWIVVLADNNETDLSRMNAIMRAINLTTSILAPAVVAQIIAFISKIAGASFIAGWNILSGAVEIYLLYKIFAANPQLAHKGGSQIPDINLEPSTPTNENMPSEGAKRMFGEDSVPTPSGSSIGLSGKDFSDVHLTPAPFKIFTVSEKFPHSNNELISSGTDLNSSTLKLVLEDDKTGVCRRLAESLKGWQDYFVHPVRFAGLGLASLYMTVLGFDSITIGYMYSQGVNESYIGIIMAAGAISGILGSLSFPFFRSKFGKCAVGNFGFGFQTCCLVACVMSIFVRGSPFVPEDVWGQELETEEFFSDIQDSGSFLSSTEKYKEVASMSVIIFITGIIISRFGLWVADLSVTQFFQEEVPEDKRGVLNGVQDSMNQAMNLIKFVLVIVLPSPATFGYLIVLSWIFVFLGWVFFMIFTCSWRKRLHKIGNSFNGNTRF